ncbi:MAG: AmpG family muropeptide MFS transporter [Stenotrophobium sp.]
MTSEPARRWRDSLRVYAQPRVLGMLFLGFSAGLPFLLVFSTLSAWLTQAGVSRTTIGYFSWVGVTYSIKFFWSPVVDRLHIPLLTRLLGRRRSWMLLAQCGIVAGLALMAFTDPSRHLQHTALLAIFVAFSAATQDISVDAYRIEAVDRDLQGAMAATYQLGYRLALIAAGAGALFIASAAGWRHAYLAMAALVGVGILTVLIIDEPGVKPSRETAAQERRVIEFLENSNHWPPLLRNIMAWLIGAVVCPFVDFFARNGLRSALTILLFVSVYRVTDIAMGVMANPFYLDLGFSLDQIASVAKIFGVIMTMTGAIAGGLLVLRLGILRTLVIGSLLVMFANFVFAFIAGVHPGVVGLALAISVDNLGSGIAGSAFIAYLSSLTNTAYTATQYALFSSIWALPGKLIGGFSGVIVDAVGYPLFFTYTALLAIPGLLLARHLLQRQNAAQALLGSAPERGNST